MKIIVIVSQRIPLVLFTLGTAVGASVLLMGFSCPTRLAGSLLIAGAVTMSVGWGYFSVLWSGTTEEATVKSLLDECPRTGILLSSYLRAAGAR